MTIPPDISQSASNATGPTDYDSYLGTPLSSTVHEHDNATEFSFHSDHRYVLTYPSIRSTSHEPTEACSEMTMLAALYNELFDDTPSATLQDEFPWHEVGVNRCTQRIPSTIVPALLQDVRSVSPCSNESFKVDEESNVPGDVERYPKAQKGKWTTGKDDGIDQQDRSPSREFHFSGTHNSVEDWVAHIRPILQDYADRQPSLPLSKRLEVSIDEPSNFILGSLQLLVNRDPAGHPRRLGPCLIENFVDIERWAKEYFRSRHGIRDVCNDVSLLLTIVMNNFWEGQVQLIDRLVEFALESTRSRGGSYLGVEDFAFGFDFRMSQDLPFYVETSSRIRDPAPIRVAEVQSTSEPVTTHSGRQVKPTKRAQEASEQAQANSGGRRDKGKNTSQAKNKQVPRSSVPPAQQKKGPMRPSSNLVAHETPSGVQAESHAVGSGVRNSDYTKYRPVRSSNLGLSPTSAKQPVTPDGTPSQPGKNSRSKPQACASTDTPKASGSSRSNPIVQPRLKIVLPALSSQPASKVSATRVSGSTSNNTNSSTLQVSPPVNTLDTTNNSRTRPRVARPSNRRASGGGPKRESGPPASNTGIPEITPEKTRTTQPANAKNEVAPTAVNSSVVPSTSAVVDEPSSSGDKSCEEPLYVSDNSLGGRGDSPTSQSTRTRRNLRQRSDPSHSEGKKRKLDDCED